MYESSIREFAGRYAFLSNFYPAQIKIKLLGRLYLFPTAEHAYQACKSTERAVIEQFVNLPMTPGEAKRYGRTIAVRQHWEGRKSAIMRYIVYLKFTQNHLLRAALLETGLLYLVEGNTWHDNFWGQCNCQKCFQVAPRNQLGVILMDTRDMLAAEFNLSLLGGWGGNEN